MRRQANATRTAWSKLDDFIITSSLKLYANCAKRQSKPSDRLLPRPAGRYCYYDENQNQSAVPFVLNRLILTSNALSLLRELHCWFRCANTSACC